jgi:hypothetical protein
LIVFSNSTNCPYFNRTSSETSTIELSPTYRVSLGMWNKNFGHY